MTDRSLEEPEDDAVERRRSSLADASSPADSLDADGAGQPADQAREIPLDVNEADAAEQERAVEIDEDDYR